MPYFFQKYKNTIWHWISIGILYAHGNLSNCGENRLCNRRDTRCRRLAWCWSPPIPRGRKPPLPPGLRHRLWPSALSESTLPSLQKGSTGIYDTRNVYPRAWCVEKRAARGAASGRKGTTHTFHQSEKNSEKSPASLRTRSRNTPNARDHQADTHTSVGNELRGRAQQRAGRARHFPAPVDCPERSSKVMLECRVHPQRVRCWSLVPPHRVA